MKERIQKILSARGLASRRQAEQWIRDGRVLCNGQVAALGDTADIKTDTILVDGKLLPPAQDHVYIMLNKPRGYVTTLSDEKGRRNVSELVEDCGCRVYPVGRLDMDSEGLLLFTNDGEFANRMMHPSHEVTKTYLVTVSGLDKGKLQKLSEPILLDGYLIKKPLVSLSGALEIDCSRLYITIHEGRNRQVRRMCAAAGLSVKRLKRVSEGTLELGDLKPGKWRYLTEKEIEKLLA